MSGAQSSLLPPISSVSFRILSGLSDKRCFSSVCELAQVCDAHMRLGVYLYQLISVTFAKE